MTAGYRIKYDPQYQGMQPDNEEFIATYDGTAGLFTPAVDTIYYVPIILPYAITIENIGIYITTAHAAKNCVLGIYPFERGVVGTKIVATDAISVASTGLQSGSVLTSLSPGTYLLAFNSDASTMICRKCNILYPILASDDGTNDYPFTHFTESQGYDGTLPTTPSLTLAETDVLRIWMELV